MLAREKVPWWAIGTYCDWTLHALAPREYLSSMVLPPKDVIWRQQAISWPSRWYVFQTSVGWLAAAAFTHGCFWRSGDDNFVASKLPESPGKLRMTPGTTVSGRTGDDDRGAS